MSAAQYGKIVTIAACVSAQTDHVLFVLCIRFCPAFLLPMFATCAMTSKDQTAAPFSG